MYLFSKHSYCVYGGIEDNIYCLKNDASSKKTVYQRMDVSSELESSISLVKETI
jgi:hypothetical protein